MSTFSNRKGITSLLRAGTRRAKRQGSIEPPRGVIKTTREKVIVEEINANIIRKKVMIITTYETINTITIYIGNRDIYCIDIQLLKDTQTNTVNTGYLTKARWDSVCSIEEPFSKGTDTINKSANQLYLYPFLLAIH